jgi:hypothetical protein
VELALEVYKAPEIDDRYLTLYIRQEKYQSGIIDRIEAVTSQFMAQLEAASGYLLITTDFRRARGNNAVWLDEPGWCCPSTGQGSRPGHSQCGGIAAVGRAYYGAFCYARNYAVKNLGYVIKGFGDDHGVLRAHLKKSRRGGDASRLDTLRQLRNDADYADDLPWDDHDLTVKEAIAAAEKVFASLPPPPPRPSK